MAIRGDIPPGIDLPVDRLGILTQPCPNGHFSHLHTVSDLCLTCFGARWLALASYTCKTRRPLPITFRFQLPVILANSYERYRAIAKVWH